jgi:hypothetical protein
MRIEKALLLIVVTFLALTLAPAHASARYLPHNGDYFNYSETIDLNSGVGSYSGYTEHSDTTGGETMNMVLSNGTVAAHYGYTFSWSNSSGSTTNGGKSGNFTYSSTSLLYVQGTDNQTGYEHSPVWFYIDNTTQNGATFYLLGTLMTVHSTIAAFDLASQGRYVAAILAEGQSSYFRNDVYGQFNAAYTWDVYFDPSTGYIIGYSYVEHDSNSVGDGFTWTDNLHVTTTSYPLTTTNPPNPTLSSFLIYVAIGVLLLGLLVVIVIAAVVIRRSRRLPKHTYFQDAGPAPPTVDLTPRQPPAQQIVIKEVVKVKCQYCGALIDSTVEKCPFCGAPRT